MATAGGGPQDGTRPDPGPPSEETLDAPDLSPGYASWSRRVVAHLLDGAILGSIWVLATGDLGGAERRMIGLTPGSGPSPWLDAPVLWVSALVLLTMQAYVGSTPGKLVVGICVVDLAEERPIGLLRTLGRWVTHALDSILLVGYMRPLWHPQNQTYADTLLRTVVLETSSPRPHRWLGGRDTEAWRRPLTVAAGALCIVAVAVSCGPSGERVSSESFAAECTTGAPYTADRTALLAGGLTLVEHHRTTSLWGWERTAAPVPAQVVDVSWQWSGRLPAEEVTLRLELTPLDPADGPTVAVEHLVQAGVVEPRPSSVPGSALDGETVPLPTIDRDARKVVLPVSGNLVEGFGEHWGWQVAMRTGTEELGTCGGRAPLTT